MSFDDISYDEYDEESAGVQQEYSSSEKYVEEVVDVHLGPGLPAGLHHLPFSLRLPRNLPASFKGQHGGVNYYVKAITVREGEMDLQVKEEIVITGLLDLNLEPRAREAASSSSQKNLGCFCWRSGTIMASLHTDRTGYVTGETIRFNAEVENLSSNDLNSVLLNLVEEVTYKTSRGEVREEREVERLVWSERILAKSGDDWEGSLRLPGARPPSLRSGGSLLHHEPPVQTGAPAQSGWSPPPPGGRATHHPRHQTTPGLHSIQSWRRLRPPALAGVWR